MTQYRIKKLGPKTYEVQKKVLWYWDNAFYVPISQAASCDMYGNTFDSYDAARSYLEEYLEERDNVNKHVPKYFYPPFPDKEPK